MASIVTYDIPNKHKEVKAAMFKKGYKDQIPGTDNCTVIYFPNTTLYHATKTPSETRDEMRDVCKDLQVNLERCIATKWEGWAAICGEDFKQ